jgi:hypothetical protein
MKRAEKKLMIRNLAVASLNYAYSKGLVGLNMQDKRFDRSTEFEFKLNGIMLHVMISYHPSKDLHFSVLVKPEFKCLLLNFFVTRELDVLFKFSSPRLKVYRKSDAAIKLLTSDDLCIDHTHWCRGFE